MLSDFLLSKRFLPLVLTQFFGALNDNLFKNALLMLVTIRMAEQADVLSNISAALFIVPFSKPFFTAQSGSPVCVQLANLH